MDYSEREAIFKKAIEINYPGLTGTNYLKLIAYTCLITRALRNKTGMPTTCAEVFSKIWIPRNEVEQRIVDVICMVCEGHLKDVNLEMYNFGQTSAKSMREEMVKILSNYTPF